LRNIIDNILGMSICAITGSFIACYFTTWSILILLAILSVFDYYFVLRSKQIPKVADILERHNVPVAISEIKIQTKYQLGFGDLIFATGLTVAFFIDGDIFAAIRTIGATTFSLCLFLSLLRKKQPYPAIPAIFAGGILSALFGMS
jgi:presenilin-like A22 family membrane protease